MIRTEIVPLSQSWSTADGMAAKAASELLYRITRQEVGETRTPLQSPFLEHLHATQNVRHIRHRQTDKLIIRPNRPSCVF